MNFRFTRAAAVVLAAALLSGASMARDTQAAPGRIDLSWGACAPVVSDVTAVPGQTLSLFASELGNDETHNAYQVRFLIADAGRQVPDAWEFDAAGCQGPPFLTINHLPPAAVAKQCPAFQGPNASIQVRDFAPLINSPNYPPSLYRGVLANTYPKGMTTLASQRYLLAEFRFEHLYSVVGPGTPGVTCGGLETPMCIALLWKEQHFVEGRSSFLRKEDGVEIAFDPGQVWLTVNGLAGCPAVPAAVTTWGQVKSAYRR